MDELLLHWDALLAAFLAKLAGLGLELVTAAGRTALKILAGLAGWLEAMGGRLSQLSPWLTIGAGLVLLVGIAGYLLRQRLYDRVLVYHLVWLRRQGYAPLRLRVRRGAVRETVQFMARRIPLPVRLDGLALYDVHPGRYAVAYDLVGDTAREVRLYRCDLRAALGTMGHDLMDYVRRDRRLLHADSEARLLFAVLDARDPLFAVSRPRLAGEVARPPQPAVTAPGRAGTSLAGSTALASTHRG